MLAATTAESVFLVEGERCADGLQALGLIATTNDGGAGKWHQEHTEPLRGRRVVILPDNDRPGAAHAEAIVKSLLGVAVAVRVVVLPGLPHKGDFVDWLAAGGTRETLLTLVALAPVVRRPSAMFPRAVDVRVLDATKVLA